MAEHISYSPTPGISYDPSEDVYWDPEALQAEVDRTFEICHGCRMCFKYCDSFPDLFSFIDDRHDGDVRSVTATETAQVMDECFQCKLCEVQCPYTVRDGHDFQLDFPKLVHRFKAQRTMAEGLGRREKLLGDPDGTARLARASGGLANALNSRSRLHRLFLEKVLGIHRDKDLPTFASTTFTKWASGEGLVSDDPTNGEAVLFPTCYVEHNEPEVGRDTVSVLQRNGVEITCEQGLVCCGMPAWEAGDLEGLQTRATTNLDRLEPHVDAGKKVLAINPTCSMMLRREYPTLVAPEDRERAAKVAEAVSDPSEFLWSIRDEDRFDEGFASTPGAVSYHAPCHLRAQAVGFRGRDLLRKIPGVKPSMTMECCGHDGTHAMKVEGFEASVRIGRRAFDEMASGGNGSAEVWATDCPLAALQFAQHADRRPLHPMTILARAYEPDGFPTPVEFPNADDPDDRADSGSPGSPGNPTGQAGAPS
jgi:Fe-S oxidoreductase|tara:strand:- start:3367 stop:4803 length:1437 start_codon:yes stop_codon:yes gene_type:complete